MALFNSNSNLILLRTLEMEGGGQGDLAFKVLKFSFPPLPLYYLAVTFLLQSSAALFSQCLLMYAAHSILSSKGHQGKD